MFLQKYKIIAPLFILSATLFAKESAPEKESTRTVHVTQCKKIEFGLTIDQKEASQNEREEALNLLSNFCNNELSKLSEQFAEKAPHVTISIVLLNIEEDASENQADNSSADTLDDSTDITANENIENAIEISDF